MEIKNKAKVLVQFTQEHINGNDYDEFFDYNDLGIPLAIAINNELVVLTEKGTDLFDETWKDLCLLFDADPDDEYESIDDLSAQ